jgi:hypothetical protein
MLQVLTASVVSPGNLEGFLQASEAIRANARRIGRSTETWQDVLKEAATKESTLPISSSSKTGGVGAPSVTVTQLETAFHGVARGFKLLFHGVISDDSVTDPVCLACATVSVCICVCLSVCCVSYSCLLFVLIHWLCGPRRIQGSGRLHPKGIAPRLSLNLFRVEAQS